MGWLRNETGLEKNAANYVPLTPLSHLRRAAAVYPDQLAVVYGGHRKSYAEYYNRCRNWPRLWRKMGLPLEMWLRHSFPTSPLRPKPILAFRPVARF